MDHSKPPEARTCAVYTRQSAKTEGDLTSCEVQRQMCVDFGRSAGRQAYRLLDKRFDDVGESGVNLNRSAMQRLRQSPEVQIHLPRPYRHLSFRIASPLPLDMEFKQEILGLRDEGERLQCVTRAIRQWILHADHVKRARAKAGGNGDIHPQS